MALLSECSARFIEHRSFLIKRRALSLARQALLIPYGALLAEYNVFAFCIGMTFSKEGLNDVDFFYKRDLLKQGSFDSIRGFAGRIQCVGFLSWTLSQQGSIDAGFFYKRDPFMQGSFDCIRGSVGRIQCFGSLSQQDSFAREPY